MAALERTVATVVERTDGVAVESMIPAAADRVLDVGGRCASVGLVILLPMPWLFGIGSTAYLPTALFVALLGALAIAAELLAWRRMAWNAFALAFFCRIAALILLAVIQTRSQGAFFLGPDGIVYFQNSVRLAARGLALPHPGAWGTYDVGQYYLFATLIRVFHADLLALQLFNSGLSALSAALIVGIMTEIRPRYASTCGLLVALFPSSISIAVFDLWKDPSVSFAMVLFVWGALKLWRAEGGFARIAFGLVLTLALMYLRCTRFYAAAYIEAALATMLMIALIRRLPLWAMRKSLAAFVVVIAVAEGTTNWLGWPLSPQLMADVIQYTIHTPAMLDGAHTPRRVPDPFTIAPGGLDRFRNIKYLPSPEDSLSRVQLNDRLIEKAANTARRLYGPFVWIVPPRWSVQMILQNDYMLYPGMLVWYAILPFVFAGLVVALAPAITKRQIDIVLCALAIFVVCYFAQYLSINLSYRQRDVTFPIAAVLACAGWSALASASWWRRIYWGYWISICIVAAIHLAVRARVGW